MPDKPSYLGLLNALAVAEAAAEQYSRAWAEATPHDEVRRLLTTVALREGEHAKAFAKRIDELGFAVRPRPDAVAERNLEIAASRELSDKEKLERIHRDDLGDDDGGPDVFAGMFADKTIDVTTGALLGRYIAEERDTIRRVRACYDHLCAAEGALATR